ncbi:MAG TPA: secretin N-terminal domain-containing protein [Pyrinomonadaceae bacterium]|jgi:hypothetical protein|nr:secretin N-terminal domain-containing protein [Pyrinomonadaceae bacterium]
MLRGLLCVAILFSCVPPAAFAVPAPRRALPPAARAEGCTAPADDKYKPFEDALAAANTELGKLKTANAPLVTATNAITEGLKKINLDEATVGQFEKVVTALKAGVSTTEGKLGAQKTALADTGKKKDELDAKYAADFKPCENVSDAPPKVKVALNNYDTFKKDYEAQQKVKGALAEAVKSIPNKAEELLNAMAEKARAAAVLRATLATQTLRTELAKTLPGMATAMRLRRLFEPVAKNLADAIDPKFPDIKELGVPKPDFKPLFDKVDAGLARALTKAPGWAEQAATAAQEEQAAAQDTLARASRDPYHNATELIALSTSAEKARKDYESLSGALQTVLDETQLEDVPEGLLPPDFIPGKAKDLSDFTSVLIRMTGRFAGTVQMLRAEVPADKSTWTMASIDLFYFDNVERLMRVLSPNTRLVSSINTQDFQGEAVRARTKLVEESQKLERAEIVLSDARAKVEKMKENLRRAKNNRDAAAQAQRGENAAERAALAKAKERERILTLRRKDIDAKKNAAQRKYDDANARAEAKPDDLQRQAERDSAKDTLDEYTFLAERAKNDEDDAHQATLDATAAGGATTELDAQVTDLKGKVTEAEGDETEAETKRTDANNAHRDALSAAFTSAQIENFAFAQARDNAPFLTNVPAPTPTPAAAASPTPTPGIALPDSDPLSRVMLFAYPDTRTIFIRGARDDIDLVRQIISEFDRPQGQAMMTLRTMEVNSDGTPGGARKALAFLKDTDGKLLVAQSLVERALAKLRDKINERVNTVVKAKEDAWDAEIKQLEGKTDQFSVLRTRQLETLKANREDTEREYFYDQRVLKALGWRQRFKDETVDTSFLNAVIPSPAKPVNLAQALIVLALATDDNRAKIVKLLMDDEALKQDSWQSPIAQLPGQTERTPAAFASLIRFVGDDGKGADILGFQSKLVEALRFNGITHVLEVAEAKVRVRLELLHERARISPELEDLSVRSEQLLREQAMLNSESLKLALKRANSAWMTKQESAALNDGLVKIDQRLKQVASEIATLTDAATQIRGGLPFMESARVDDINNNLARIEIDLPAMLGWLQGNDMSASTTLLRERIEQAVESDDSTSVLLAQAAGLRRSARFRFSQANESAVNLTFRKYLEQVNRDLTETYVKPAFRDINERMLKEKLGVGVIQETSILASNRLVARVDPRGSAQLAVGEEQNVLEAARQLTNLFGIAGKSLATGKTGSPLALAGGPLAGAASAIQTAQEVFSALDQLPRDARPTVYGISTGNLFQVTPVIDPSGQALRFRFDLVSATQIREPDDTIDPLLPRIERHSVNTEVHLGDQEIRLISQFQANSRVGLPTHKSGGIPIIKDIPGVSVVPLIGWFVRRGGRNSQTQQSFIFCQTAMYPTLGEVLDVAVQSPTFTGLDSPAQ